MGVKGSNSQLMIVKLILEDSRGLDVEQVRLDYGHTLGQSNQAYSGHYCAVVY